MKRTAHRTKRLSGYTLIDAMIVVSIIAILSALSFNGYNLYKARAKRPEAQMTFRALADAQRSHKILYGAYAPTFDELGFHLDSSIRVSSTEIQGTVYNYKLSQPAGPGGWYLVATGNIDGDAYPDIFSAQSID